MCGCEDGEPPEFYRERLISRARKAHRCCECSRAIPVGAAYRYTAGKWDGCFNEYTTCLRCEALAEAFHDVEGCWAPLSMLRETIQECVREGMDQREFGVRVRAYLGKYGPQLPRRAA